MRIDPFANLLQKIVQIEHIPPSVFHQWFEKILVVLVRSDIDDSTLFDDVSGSFHNLGSLDSRLFVLEIAPPNVKAVKVSTVFGPQFVDDPGRRTLNIVNIPDVVSDKALHPQIGLVVLKEQKCVKMNQQSPASLCFLCFAVKVNDRGLL